VKDIQITEVAPADILVGMKQGSIDGGYIVTPFWKQLEKDGTAKLVPNTGFSLASYIMPLDFIKAKPDVAKAILRAIMRTQRTYLQGNYHNDAKVVAAISQAVGAPETTITSADPLNFTKDLIFAPSATQVMQDLQQVWLDNNILQYKTAIPLDKINDLSMAQDVAAGK
jgi:NitT/TauT family transport system substrate-binding protein